MLKTRQRRAAQRSYLTAAPEAVGGLPYTQVPIIVSREIFYNLRFPLAWRRKFISPSKMAATGAGSQSDVMTLRDRNPWGRGSKFTGQFLSSLLVSDSTPVSRLDPLRSV